MRFFACFFNQAHEKEPREETRKQQQTQQEQQTTTNKAKRKDGGSSANHLCWVEACGWRHEGGGIKMAALETRPAGELL